VAPHKEFETVNELGSPTKIFTKEMEAYGFSDYFGVGDIIAHEQGGYLHDGIISAMGVNWLRGRGMELAAQRKPWFLAVNLSTHTISCSSHNRPSGRARPGTHILGHIMPEPTSPFYSKHWRFNLRKPTRSDSTRRDDLPPMPTHLKSHDALVGNIPNEDWPWQRRHNYYLNCLRDVDRNITPLLDELNALGFASNTIIVLTSDHGDLDGAHRLHSKGATFLSGAEQRPADHRASSLPRRQAVQGSDIPPRYRSHTRGPDERRLPEESGHNKRLAREGFLVVAGGAGKGRTRSDPRWPTLLLQHVRLHRR